MANRVNDSENIIVDEQDRNHTIDAGIKLINSSGQLTSTVRAKSVGLKLVLLGMAEINALRIANLATAAFRLEQRLYSPEVINKLDPRKLLDTYMALSEVLKDSIGYVQGIEKGTNWAEIESQLEALSKLDTEVKIGEGEDATKSKAEVSKVARELLSIITKDEISEEVIIQKEPIH